MIKLTLEYKCLFSKSNRQTRGAIPGENISQNFSEPSLELPSKITIKIFPKFTEICLKFLQVLDVAEKMEDFS